MKLEHGIKVIHGRSHRTPPRLLINSGTELIKTTHIGTVKYRAPSFIPAQDWRELDRAEEHIAFDFEGSQIQHGRWIAVIEIPSELLRSFNTLKVASAKLSLHELSQLSKSPHFEQSIDDLVDYFSQSCFGPVSHSGIFVSGSNKITTTYTHGPSYIGLHVDSIYGGLCDRDYRPVRICVNLGAGHRFLQYINTPFSTIIEGIDVASKAGISATALGQDFLSLRPKYPVLSLGIAPGEAYIAPTENIIHDGSTIGNPFFDVQFTAHGAFKCPAD